MDPPPVLGLMISGLTVLLMLLLLLHHHITMRRHPWRRHKKLKKGKSTGGSTSKSWSITDPEFQRKKRVASYKVYSVEGKVKGTFRKSFRWLKDRYTQVVYGWW
ncbi:UNVERIFIED_CONTAM: hypothetical protein Sangu_1824600 [Sesamum angustifolium]|uniref:Uncharacterized protein n=1 Tax=Sesamum angustifolium TaxID=2727405 RepID=A0AAW2M8F3_9LAMI